MKYLIDLVVVLVLKICTADKMRLEINLSLLN